MRNLDRFDSRIDEPNGECANCGASVPVGDLLYDEHAEVYFCDRQCFDEWHDKNPLLVGDYYYEMNIGY